MNGSPFYECTQTYRRMIILAVEISALWEGSPVSTHLQCLPHPLPVQHMYSPNLHLLQAGGRMCLRLGITTAAHHSEDSVSCVW